MRTRLLELRNRATWYFGRSIFKQFMKKIFFKLEINLQESYLLLGFLKHKIFGLSEGNANRSTAMDTPTQASVTYLCVLNMYSKTTLQGTFMHTFKGKEKNYVDIDSKKQNITRPGIKLPILA